jgi:L-rhamnose isomerase
MTRSDNIQSSYAMARERYAEYDVDADAALERLAGIAVSLHCWQGDDVAGFESGEGLAGGGIMATGNYPGKAQTPDELRSDLGKALSLIPGRHRVSIHASYLETGGKKVDRNEIQPEHFANWIDWAKGRGLGMDFNHTFFSHPKAASGFTLSSYDEGIRNFWIEHGIACRRIAEHIRRGGVQAVRYRLGELCNRLVRVLSGLCDQEPYPALSGRGAFSSDGSHLGQDFIGAALSG